MVKIYSEANEHSFAGTIIDLETIGGPFRNFDDSRRYGEFTPVIFGFINQEGMQIHCAKKVDSIGKLKLEIERILTELESKRPFYAFNTHFERGSLFHYLSESIEFDGELNEEQYEPKWRAVRKLEIPNYDDPFNDDGKACSLAWMKGEIDKAIAHNRSCLLKERDILLFRGSRIPDELRLVEL